MERKKEKVRFQKLGGGSFRLPGRIIKPNQFFWAYPEEIPQAFRDSVKPVDDKLVFEGKSEKQEIAQTESVEPHYYKHHKGGGVFDIYREGDDKLMSSGIKGKEEADRILDQLNPQDEVEGS